MGHLINPLATRLGISTFWSSNSVTLKTGHDTHFAFEDIFFQKLFAWFYNFLEKNNFLFTHVIINRLFEKTFFCAIIYNATIDSIFYPFYENIYNNLIDKKERMRGVLNILSHFKKVASKTKGALNKKVFVPTFKKRDKLFFKKYKSFKFLKFFKKFNRRFIKRPLYNTFFEKSIFFKKMLFGSKKYYRQKNSIKYFLFRKKKNKPKKVKFSFFQTKKFHLRNNKKTFNLKKNAWIFRFRYLRSFYFNKFFYPFFIKRKLMWKAYQRIYFVTKFRYIFNKAKNKYLKSKFLKKRKINLLSKPFIKKSFYKHHKKTKQQPNFDSFKKDKLLLVSSKFFPFLTNKVNLLNFLSFAIAPCSIFVGNLSNSAYSFFKNLYFWYFFNFKNNLLGFFLNNSLNVKSKLNFLFFFLTSGAFNASLVCKYIVARLHKGALLFDIIKPLILKLIAFERVSGFKISCAGRFSRKQIAAYSWQRRGELPLNSFGRVVDYYNSSAFLNNSVCGLKVWLCFPENSLLIRTKGFFFSGKSFSL